MVIANKNRYPYDFARSHEFDHPVTKPAPMTKKYSRVIFCRKVWLIPTKLVTEDFKSAFEKVVEGKINTIDDIEFTLKEYDALTDGLYSTNTIAGI